MRARRALLTILLAVAILSMLNLFSRLLQVIRINDFLQRGLMKKVCLLAGQITWR